jgi:hypothetical protein
MKTFFKWILKSLNKFQCYKILIVFCLQIELWNRLTYEQAHALISKMQKMTTTKIMTKEQITEKM